MRRESPIFYRREEMLCHPDPERKLPPAKS
jgi:hypothetical protein